MSAPPFILIWECLAPASRSTASGWLSGATSISISIRSRNARLWEMRRPLVIHGSYMGGFGLPGALALGGVLVTVPAVLSRIWARPAGLTVWLIVMGFSVRT